MEYDIFFLTESGDTPNLIHTLEDSVLLFIKKKKHCLVNRDRWFYGGIADCISSNTRVRIRRQSLSRLLILSDKTFKADISLSCGGAFCSFVLDALWLVFALNNGVI